MINSRFLKCSLLVCALAGSSCAMTRDGHLYDTTSAEVIPITYGFSGTGHGNVWLGTKDIKQADCKGEYATVAAGETGWGLIFGAGNPIATTGGVTSSEQHGRAIATCKGGRIIECEYVANEMSHGHGACQDNSGKRYRLMF